MKKIILLFTVLFIQISIAFGQNGRIEIHNGDSLNNYKLLYMADMSSDVVVSVFNENGKTIEKVNIKDKKGFSYNINLSDYNTGKYFVEVFTPLFTLYDTIDVMSEIDHLKASFEGEIKGAKIIVSAIEPIKGVFRLVINENNKLIISDQKIKGSEFGTRIFDFNGSTADITNVSIYYKGNKINTWSVESN